MDIMEPVPADRRKISYEEFLTRCDDRNAAEWVDGEIIYMTVSADHTDLNTWLTAILRAYLEHYGIGRVFADPFQISSCPRQSPSFKMNQPNKLATILDCSVDERVSARARMRTS